MKTATTILLPLFVAGLLLGGCSGLDDDPEPGRENPSDFEGSYQFFTFTGEGTCTIPRGIIMRVSLDGTVTSNPKIDLDTGETIRVTGRVRADGSVKGKFDYSFSGHSGDYDGVMSTIECEKDDEGFITGIGGGGGEWIDYQSGVSDCNGSWLACPINITIR